MTISASRSKTIGSGLDKQYVKDTVRDIIKKSNRKVKVNTTVFESIMRIEKQKAKVGRGIGKFLDSQDDRNKTAFERGRGSNID